MSHNKTEHFGVSENRTAEMSGNVQLNCPSEQGWGFLHLLIMTAFTIGALYLAYHCSDRSLGQYLLAFFCSTCYIGFYASQGFAPYVAKASEAIPEAFGFKY